MATYKIIGGDHREYGPVTFEELKEWIEEGRANLQSLVQEEGTGMWKPLAAFPDLAEVFLARFPEHARGKAAARVEARRDAPVRIGECLRRGWELAGRQFGRVALASFLVWLIESGLDFVPLVGGVAALIVRGYLYGSLSFYILRLIRGEEPPVGSLFCENALQLILTGIVVSVLVQLGMLMCLFGVILLVAWAFALALAADKRLDFWSAMETSRRAVMPRFLQVAGLMIAAYLPVLICTIYINGRFLAEIMQVMEHAKPSDPSAYLKLFSNMMQQNAGKFISYTLLYKAVWLVNLPLAFAPMMYAYEELFGAAHDPGESAAFEP